LRHRATLLCDDHLPQDAVHVTLTLFVGFMFARPSWINVPFFIAGTLKILYDLLLYRAFVTVPPPEEAR
jgi:hypothetical protein